MAGGVSSLLRDLNDSDDDARRIVELTSGIPCKINLVRFNPHDGAEFFPSSLQVSERLNLPYAV
jgi:adenine C2-methylase RlmN of 23S rRNA A2503 and tRNA A37